MRRQSIKKPISEVKITNPYPVGSVKYKEFEKDLRKLKYTDKSADIDEFGNILLILIFLAICAS